jgi:hypothetical protein
MWNQIVIAEDAWQDTSPDQSPSTGVPHQQSEKDMPDGSTPAPTRDQAGVDCQYPGGKKTL